jgi:hypothetical protein
VGRRRRGMHAPCLLALLACSTALLLCMKNP